MYYQLNLPSRWPASPGGPTSAWYYDNGPLYVCTSMRASLYAWRSPCGHQEFPIDTSQKDGIAWLSQQHQDR